MKIGYARVSTDDQNLERQLDSLKNFGCEKIYTDKISGSTTDRPQLNELLSFIRKGDCLVVHELSRLGRSLSNLVKMIDDLKAKEISFISLSQGFDTTTPGGNMFFQIAAAFAEYERAIIAERTKEGVAAARKQGRLPGRKKSLTTQQVEMAMSLVKDGNLKKDIAKNFGVNEKTLRRAIQNYYAEKERKN